jgi:hypothetical protein
MSRPTRSARGFLVSLACGLLACAVGPAAAGAAPAKPSLELPAADATVEAVPAFSWKKARRAVKYEFQLSADTNFGSIVLGQGRGSFTTPNTAATIPKSIPDGTYFWRVRGLDAKGNAGRWSEERSIVKAWSTRPGLLGPASNAAVMFPTVPLILRWTAVPRASKYNLYIATDPGLGSLAVGAGGAPVQTSGTVFSPPNSLAPGVYYWAVEPIDAANHRGRRSAVGSFVWSWPTATLTRTTDLIDDQRLMDPRFSWDPVPGAVAYQVEVNSSSDFATGSKVCCNEQSTGTSLAPVNLQPNNVYYWRVRALDAEGNAGQWNVGGSFDKNFGNYRGAPGIPPTVAGLRLRDHDSPGAATDLDPATAVVDTDTPVVTWDPVPGAASYEAQVTPTVDGACNWSTTRSDRWLVETATTAWTPLTRLEAGATRPDPAYPGPATDGQSLVPGEDYCFRVRGKTKDDGIYSEWSQYPGTGSTPAFRSVAQPAITPVSGQITMAESDYLEPQTGTTHTKMPLFTWKRVTGAGSYWVVVSRDQLFTNIVDLALTRIPAYAPRHGTSPWTYEDDDSPLYWAVLPAKGVGGGQTTSQPPENFQRWLYKQSVPPAPFTPSGGVDVTDQPEFRWSLVDGARDYRLQVSQDPTFADNIEDLVTTSTSYTSARYYPADTVLYWRVRANDVRNVGMRWSQTQTFRRRLLGPAPSEGNSLGGSIIPALTWQPVQGARSYSIHVDQADGSQKDFTQSGTSFTPTVFYGVGVWRWQVRANYGASGTTVSSGYFPLIGFARRIPAPDGVRVEYRAGRMLISWDAALMVKQYRVQLSTTNSFSTTFANFTTDNLAWAPDISTRAFADGGEIFWRVAATDEGNNVGGWTTGAFKVPKRMVVKVVGRAVRRKTGTVTLTVSDFRGRRLRRAKVSVSGVARAKSKRTGRKGTVKFRIRARRKGTVKFRVTLAGHQPQTAVLKVG